MARTRSHPDLVVGSPERWRAERSTGESIVAAARRWLLASVGAPIASDRRVVVIEQADRANEQAQNALLKVLEEPAPRQMFILVADDASLLLPTIRSRSQSLRVGAVPRADLAAHLVARYGMPLDRADLISRVSGGLAGAAARYAEQPELMTWRERTQQELLELLRRGRADRFGSLRDLLDAAGRLTGAEPPRDESEAGDAAIPVSAQRAAALAITDAWVDLARDLLVARAGREDLAPVSGILDGFSDAARLLDSRQLVAFLDRLEQVRDGLLQNAAPRLAMEAAMLSWPVLPSSVLAS